MIAQEKHWNFNTCPLCKDKGKRVILMWPKGAETTDPCSGCGTKFKGYIAREELIHNNGTSKGA